MTPRGGELGQALVHKIVVGDIHFGDKFLVLLVARVPFKLFGHYNVVAVI